MTRLALTALATAAAYVIGWKSASAWWGRCASGCRRGASNGAGLVSVGAPRPQTGAQHLDEAAARYARTIGVDQPVEKRREEALRLGDGAPVRRLQIDPWVAYAAELDAELMTSNPDLYFAQARERARRFVRRTA